MFISPIKLVGLSVGLAAAAPFNFPLQNGFPNPSNDSIQQIAIAAGGTLSNGPPPPKADPDTLNSFRLLALNEIFEVAFFTDLVYNITHQVPGYVLPSDAEKFTVDSLTAVIAQEELHTLNVNGLLKNFKQDPIQACQFQFPVDNFSDAIALAQTFTDVALAVLQDVQQNAVANSGADVAGIVRAVASVIGQEGQQDGFYRGAQGKRPSAEPFLTNIARDFVFTALQQFIVPGSCPNIDQIKFKVFQPLTLLTKEVCDGPIEFQATNSDKATIDPTKQNLVYVNGVNVPVIVPFTVERTEGNNVYINANFPHDKFVMDGLTVASIVNGAGPFASVDDVAKAALFGPGLIEVN